MKKPSVVFFQRKPYPSGNYSLEFIFSELRKRLYDEIKPSVSECRFYSQGILNEYSILLKQRLNRVMLILLREIYITYHFL